jgi:hypothetical protein
MRATRLSKLWLKALRTDSNTIASVPLNFTKLSGQNSNFMEVRDTDDATVLAAISASGARIENGGATVTQIATVAISAANVTDTAAGHLGHAAGVVLVADPGAGKVVELISVVMSFTYSTAQYGAGGNITVNINGGAALTGLVSAANSLGAAADKLVQFVPLSTAGNALTVNKGVNLVAASAFTNPGTAAGTVKVIVAYRIHTL